ncbi:MAG: hypothetical protein CVV56_04145 [Tenericutes bacterium HGW-Tenericutes-1]|jgi:uncharacterized membrane protein YhhN|nr:MAG: hypothetical protein CVV56_04145 [Tenericutes bacterium HGW-Tenericutes-1]
MIYLGIFLSVGLVGLYIFIETLGKPLQSITFKGLASFGFIFLYVISVLSSKAYLSHPTVVFLFGLGLVAGLMGDIYLALRPLRPVDENHQIILIGTFCFMVGHTLYYSAIIINGSFSIWAIVISTIITITTFMASKLLKLNWGPSKIPSIIYSFFLFLVAGQAFMNGLSLGFNGFNSAVTIGAILFGISDLILAQIYFGGKTSNPFIILNLSTYYAAQILLAFSLYLL